MVKHYLCILTLALTTGLLSAAPKVVVLPERFTNVEVIVKGSAVYQAVIAQSKTLEKQIAAEDKRHTDYAQQVGDQLRAKDDRIAVLESENKTLKAAQRPHIPIWNILSLIVGFVGNPFSFVITRFVELGLALVAIVLCYFLARYLWKRFRNHQSTN